MMKKLVLIDCDPGHDDAIALLLAFARKEWDILSVTTVAGNQTLEKTLHNALAVLSYAEIKVPVAAGYAKPLLRKLITAPEIHGETGLDGPALPEPNFSPEPVHGVRQIIETIRKQNGKVTVITTGPLTNLAAALIGAPDIKEKIEKIVSMGGAAGVGNWTPAAEFNILVDPEAASFVFTSGIPLTMVGLDVTNQAIMEHDDIDWLKRQDRKIATFVAELLEFFIDQERVGVKGAPMHDPLAVAVAAVPEVVVCKKYPVKIEMGGNYTTGRTVVDFNRITGEEPNVDVALELNRDLFFKLLKGAILSYG